MKRVKTYDDFLTESILNEGVMSVGEVKIDSTAADRHVDEKIKETATEELKKKFKDSTGLDIEPHLKDLATFMKGQLTYINPILYKKDLTQAEFDKMTTDLVSRMDVYIKKKAESLLEEMPWKIKSALSVVPESMLKKKIQDQNKYDEGGAIQDVIEFVGDIPGWQDFTGPNLNPKIPWEVNICPKPSPIKTTPTGKPFSYEGTVDARSDLFTNWAYDNTFWGKKLVQHYIDLIVPILA